MMAILNDLIQQYPNVLLAVHKNSVGTKRINMVRTTDVIMDDSSVFLLTDEGWEIARNSLELEKIIKNSAIDRRTQELIDRGLYFDGFFFSLSEKAQLNWIAMSASADIIPWPVEITTIDDKKYTLTKSKSNAFFFTAIGTKQYWLDYGRNLKTSVNATTTYEQLDAIVDPRT